MGYLFKEKRSKSKRSVGIQKKKKQHTNEGKKQTHSDRSGERKRKAQRNQFVRPHRGGFGVETSNERTIG